MRRESHKALMNAVQRVLDVDASLEVLDEMLRAARDLLMAEAASVFLIERNGDEPELVMAASTNVPAGEQPEIRFPVGVGVSGWVAKHGRSANVADITDDPRYYSDVSRATGFPTRGYLCVPLKVRDDIVGTLQVLNRTEGDKFGEADRELLESFAVIAALAIRKSRMHEEALERRRIQGELAVAREVQQGLLPRDFAPPEGYRIAGYNRPARQMGGDIYDAVRTDVGYTVLLGDVSGKGPAAALWTSGLASVVRFVASQGTDPLTQVEKIDRHLAALLPTEAFITAFIGCLAGDQLHYVSAGHNPALLLLPGGEVKWLDSTGPMLGAVPDVPKAMESVQLPRGARLVLYTDGVTEAENPDGEMYGEKRLEEVALRHADASPEEITKAVIVSLTGFCGAVEQGDDITMLVVARD